MFHSYLLEVNQSPVCFSEFVILSSDLFAQSTDRAVIWFRTLVSFIEYFIYYLISKIAQIVLAHIGFLSGHTLIL